MPLIDWLDYNGFSVVTKLMKSFTDSQGNRKLSGNMDVEIAVDAMEMAQHVGHIVLFSGDGDFCSVVRAVQRRDVKVTVVSSIALAPRFVPMSFVDKQMSLLILSICGRKSHARAGRFETLRMHPALGWAFLSRRRPTLRSSEKPAWIKTRTHFQKE